MILNNELELIFNLYGSKCLIFIKNFKVKSGSETFKTGSKETL
jgi:uncharacterized Zn ribbon protein